MEKAKNILSWKAGTDKGLLRSKHHKKGTNEALQIAKAEALSALRARPEGAPLEPPPWWESQFASALEMHDEGCIGDEDDEGEEEGEEEAAEAEAAPSAANYEPALVTRRTAAKLGFVPKSLFKDGRVVDDDEEEVEDSGDGASDGASDGAGDGGGDVGGEDDEVDVEEEAKIAQAASRPPVDAATASIEDATAAAWAMETGHRGPSGTATDGWDEYLQTTTLWANSLAPELAADTRAAEGGARAIFRKRPAKAAGTAAAKAAGTAAAKAAATTSANGGGEPCSPAKTVAGSPSAARKRKVHVDAPSPPTRVSRAQRIETPASLFGLGAPEVRNRPKQEREQPEASGSGEHLGGHFQARRVAPSGRHAARGNASIRATKGDGA